MSTRQRPNINRIFVENGLVTRAESWVTWKGEDWPTVVIERKGGGFKSQIGGPDYGGTASGTLKEVLRGLHPDARKKYEILFSLKNPTQGMIDRVGFKRCQLQEVA